MEPALRHVEAWRSTDPVTDDPDDPAIWLHPTDRSKTLILGTNKVAAPAGALVVFGLDGRVRQTIGPIDRPNNVDVEYGLRVGSSSIDIAVVTERLQSRLRVFRIEPMSGRLDEVGQVPVLVGETGEKAEPMGIALYRRPTDGTVFAIVAPKSGGATDYLWQYALAADANGRVTGHLVRRFGSFSGKGAGPDEPGEIEAVVVDDELGYAYFADERHGIRKWHADPAHTDAAKELAVFGTLGYQADREGLALYRSPGHPGRGWIVSVDQIDGRSALKAYRREGRPGAPHDHSALAFEVTTNADGTDGLEVVSDALPDLPHGMAVMMNSTPKTFVMLDWAGIAGSLSR